MRLTDVTNKANMVLMETTKTNETELLARLGLTDKCAAESRVELTRWSGVATSQVLSAIARLRDEAATHLDNAGEAFGRGNDGSSALSRGRAQLKLDDMGALLAMVLR